MHLYIYIPLNGRFTIPQVMITYFNFSTMAHIYIICINMHIYICIPIKNDFTIFGGEIPKHFLVYHPTKVGDIHPIKPPKTPSNAIEVGDISH